MKKVLAMDDIVGELRDCAADSAEVGYKSRAQVAMLRAADDIVALQGRIVRQCQSVNELVAATEKCIEERDALRARVAELEIERDYLKARNEDLVTDRARMRGHLFRIRDGGARTTSGKWLDWTRTTLREVAQDALNGAPVPVLKGEIGLPSNKTAASNEVPK